MIEDREMQQLHLLAAQGKELSAIDEAKLKSWYEKLDGEESVINQNNRPFDMAELRQKIDRTTRQVSAVSVEITVLLTQNEEIRHENEELRRQLESRLVEQAA